MALVPPRAEALAAAPEGVRSSRHDRRQSERDGLAPALVRGIDDFLARDDRITRENSNKPSEVIATSRDLLAGTVSRAVALERLLPPHLARAHKRGWIHIHDLDYTLAPYFNCMLVDVPGMLKHGFVLGGASIEPPKSIRTAAEVIPQIVVNASSNIYGGIGLHKLDEVLEPYGELSYRRHLATAAQWIEDEGRRDDYARAMTRKEIYDSMQSLEYEINSAYSGNGQTPFVTVNFGLTTSWIGREIQIAMLRVRLLGLGADHRTATFPKLVFTLKHGVNADPGDPNYDIKRLALETAAHRIYPDVLSYERMMEIWGYEISPMGCRSFLPLHRGPDGEPMTYGRRNVGVCTLNLPNIALSSETQADFWRILDERIGLVRDALLWRYHRLAQAHAGNAPILYEHGATGHRLSADSPVQQIFDDGEASLSIGYIGLSEVAARFFGDGWETGPDAATAKQFTLEVLRRINVWKDRWTRQTGLGFSVYGTPSESLTDRFARLDRTFFGPVAGITDKDWYTNSFHYRSDRPIDPFSKFDFEAPYPALSAGGNICYVEVPNLTANLDALEAIWDHAAERVPYFGVNSPVSRCYRCGYAGSFDADAHGFFCPECGNRDPERMECIERLCGYISDVAARPPVAGRVDEIAGRVRHLGTDQRPRVAEDERRARRPGGAGPKKERE